MSKNALMIPIAEPFLGEEELRNITEVVKSGWISSKGKFISEFEEKFAEYCGCKLGIATSNGTAALHLALKALGIKNGDEVIVPTLSFIATANAVTYCGAKPIFVDSDPNYWCMDPEKIEEKITENTKAIIPVHLYGHPCFCETTKVLTPCGEISIKDVVEKKIKYVLGILNGIVQPVKVLNYSSHLYKGLIYQIKPQSNDKIEATPNHPFYTTEHGWTQAQDLNNTTHIICVTSNMRGICFDENLDRKSKRTSKRSLSDCKTERGASKNLSHVFLEANQRRGTISKIKSNHRTSCDEYQQREKQGYRLSTFERGRNRLSRRINRRRRNNNFSRLQKKVYITDSSHLQQQQIFDGIPEQVGSIPNPNEQALRILQWRKQIPLYNLLDRIKNSPSPQTHITLSQGEERTRSDCSGVLRETFECTDKFDILSFGMGYSLKNTEIESTTTISKTCIVYNIQTESQNYFINKTLVHNCDMGAIMAIARDYDLYVVEDAAEAHGAEYKGKKVGSFGDINCYSFFANKIITTGEGGMCLTDSNELAERIRILRDHGMNPDKKYWHDVVGFNYRMTNMQAALGAAQLGRIEKIIEIKRSNATQYNSLLKDVDSITLPPEEKWAKNVYWMYSILIDHRISRDDVMKKLESCGIESRPFFYPIHTMPPYRGRVFPIAEVLSKIGISLPSSAKLKREEIEKISDAINQVM